MTYEVRSHPENMRGVPRILLVALLKIDDTEHMQHTMQEVVCRVAEGCATEAVLFPCIYIYIYACVCTYVYIGCFDSQRVHA